MTRVRSLNILLLCLALGGAAACEPAPGTQVEIYSSWVTGPESVGLRRLSDAFHAQEPEARIVNMATETTGGTEADLRDRMLQGDPPDGFQVHMGHELIDTWVKTGYMEPLDGVYQQYGLSDAFAPGILSIVSYEGHPYSVPVNIHRANVLWYNKKVLEDNGIDPATLDTFDGWKAAADKLKAAGITPLALGDRDRWADTNLFETVLIGTLGADKYKGLFDGSTDWNGDDVKEALERFATMTSYVDSDHAALTWDQANQQVIEGKAAFTIMGDWVDADYGAKGFTGYGWAPPPGNKGVYDAMANSFGLPKGSKHAELMKEFLGVLGSRQGQETFNRLQGSICPRTDCDYSAFDPYLQSSAADWETDTIVPSLAHGGAAGEGWSTAINDAIGGFVASGDVAATQAALVRACRAAGVCR